MFLSCIDVSLPFPLPSPLAKIFLKILKKKNQELFSAIKISPGQVAQLVRT